ncbi:Uncharacterized protein APZ42_028274 [Daphnia magna]|uniref:Uncharacterized protein n=1 Tax=Daphnia magna TaxID=35525 RepID=A0A164QMB5_9CRUS|nr:Uncharacterized protein APZ42_028274 [Daphnia magna]
MYDSLQRHHQKNKWLNIKLEIVFPPRACKIDPIRILYCISL